MITLSRDSTPKDLYFIHGMWGTPAVWDTTRAYFEALGHVTRAPALPFHDRRRGEAPPPELAGVGLQDYVDFLVDDVSRLAAPPVIVGHSMGSFLAQAVAARVQPAGVVLLSPAPTASANVVGFDPLRAVWPVVSKWGWWREPTLIDAEAARWGIFNNVPAEIAEAELEALVWDSGRALAQLSVPWAMRDGAAKVDYARLTMPALVVTGTADRITLPGVARATARAWSGAVDYHELPRVGHWLFHAPVIDRVHALIGAWLGRTYQPVIPAFAAMTGKSGA